MAIEVNSITINTADLESIGEQDLLEIQQFLDNHNIPKRIIIDDPINKALFFMDLEQVRHWRCYGGKYLLCLSDNQNENVVFYSYSGNFPSRESALGAILRLNTDIDLCDLMYDLEHCKLVPVIKVGAPNSRKVIDEAFSQTQAKSVDLDCLWELCL